MLFLSMAIENSFGSTVCHSILPSAGCWILMRHFCIFQYVFKCYISSTKYNDIYHMESLKPARGRPLGSLLQWMTRPPRGSRPSRGSLGPLGGLGPPRPLGPPGQSFHSAAIHGDTPRDVEMGPALAGLLGSPALPDSRSISIPGIPTLPGAQPSLSGVRPTLGFTGTPRGPGNFHGRGNCQPSGRHHPSTVNDVALSGHSALPWHFPSMVSFACPGAQPSLSGVRPPPGFIEPLWGPGNFQGRSKCQPSGRHRPSTWWN